MQNYSMNGHGQQELEIEKVQKKRKLSSNRKEVHPGFVRASVDWSILELTTGYRLHRESQHHFSMLPVSGGDLFLAVKAAL